MLCPACGRDNPAGTTRCRKCGITLFAPPVSSQASDVELVPLLLTEDYALIPILKSLLESEGIDYLERGVRSQDLRGIYGGAAGTSMPGGPTEFVVRAADLDRARQLLEDLRSTELPEGWEPDESS